MLHILTVFGARPEFIKSGPMSKELKLASIRETLVHTGQHYDTNMSDVFFSELDLPTPDHFLGVGSGSHGQQTGRMLEKIESLLLSDRPDGVLVYGDTNSTLAGALAAAKWMRVGTPSLVPIPHASQKRFVASKSLHFALTFMGMVGPAGAW